MTAPPNEGWIQLGSKEGYLKLGYPQVCINFMIAGFFFTLHKAENTEDGIGANSSPLEAGVYPS